MEGGGPALALGSREPGPWLLRGTLIEESTAREADWKSLFTTMTIAVRPRP